MTKRKPKSKNKKEEPKWRTIERVVGLLEAAIDPNATVEHDIHLPDLATSGLSRQCDVVVTTGAEFRRTRTIVEVQRRNRPVNIAHFEGWVAKMRAVGAQHLICVSTSGFPHSVKLKAAQLGPTIRLVTLKELAKGSPLLQGSLGMAHLREIGTTDYPAIELLVKDREHLPPSGGTIVQHEPNLRTQSGEILSLNQIAQRLLDADPRPSALPDGIHPIDFETADTFSYLANEAAGPVRLRFTVNVKVHSSRFDCDVLEYVQAPEAGPLGWVLLGETPCPAGTGTYQIKITFCTGPDGRLLPRSINVDGLQSGYMFSAGIGGMHAGPVLVT